MKIKFFYVVWAGAKPGIYDSWEKCQAQIHGYSGAQYKKYSSREEAEKAFRDGPGDYYKRGAANGVDLAGAAALDNINNPGSKRVITPDPCPIDTAMCVHVAVDRKTGDITYNYGWHMPFGNKKLSRFSEKCPASGVSQNIAEFDALVTGLIDLKNRNRSYPIYTQSDMAIRYLAEERIDQMEVGIMLKQHPDFATVIKGKCGWLSRNRNRNKVGRWNVREWGPNPAARNSHPF